MNQATTPPGSNASTRHWLLAGRPPVDLAGVHPSAQMSTVAASQPPRLRDLAPHIPQSVAAVIEKAIARDPAGRYATIGDFAAALGSRAAVARKWRRTNEHPTHIGCWRGERVGASTYVLCVEQGGKPGSCTVATRHLSSNARVPNGARACRVRNWPQAVRAVMRALS
jgi:eukaryotic-like serine/threonine-protein kinase